MYRIRVFNEDGTLGGFYSDDGIVSDPSLAKTYPYQDVMKEDLVKAFNKGGGIKYPLINYGITSTSLANDEKENFDSFASAEISNPKSTDLDINRMPSFLPPFEDKPTRGGPDEGVVTLPIAYFDYDGGNLDQQQENDIDGGGA